MEAIEDNFPVSDFKNVLVASLDCYVCVPPKYKGTRSPPCEFDAHDWGVLETCPQQSNVCIASVQGKTEIILLFILF